MQYTKPTSEVCEVNTLHTFLNTEKKRKCIYFSLALRIHCNTIHLNRNQFLSTQVFIMSLHPGFGLADSPVITSQIGRPEETSMTI